MKKIKEIIRSTNRLCENPGGGKPTRKEYSEEVVNILSEKFGVPKVAIREYSVILLNEMVQGIPLHTEVREGKDKMRLGFLKAKNQ